MIRSETRSPVVEPSDVEIEPVGALEEVGWIEEVEEGADPAETRAYRYTRADESEGDALAHWDG
jgi:hypothetical protein